MGQKVAEDSVDATSEHDDWLKGALGLDIQVVRPGKSVSQETPEQAHRRELNAEVDKRHAERDARVDEYGIKKPPVAWVTKIADDVAPPEIMNVPSSPWYEVTGRAAAAGVGAAIVGHFMDNISPVDTRGDWHMPVPLLGELAHSEAENRYEREREAYEEKLREEAARQMEEADNQTPEEEDQKDAAQEPGEKEDAQSKADEDGQQVCDPNTGTSDATPVVTTPLPSDSDSPSFNDEEAVCKQNEGT